MTHGHHIYAKASDMAKAKMWTYPQSGHALPHCKGVLRCAGQETDKNMRKQHAQLGFTFITSLDVVLIMVKSH